MANRGSRNHAVLDGRRWARLRLAVFRRDRFRCRKCNRAGRLECDHVVPMREGGDQWGMGNLQALCRSCHIRKTAGENRRPDPERDAWRALVAAIANS